MNYNNMDLFVFVVIVVLVIVYDKFLLKWVC